VSDHVALSHFPAAIANVTRAVAAGSVSKLSVGVQTNGTYKGRLSLRKGEGRVRVSPSENVLPGGIEPLTLILSPWRRERRNGMELTTGEHYPESYHFVIAL
jgi:hypothetical protein